LDSGAEVNRTNNEGNTPLIFAASNGNKDLVQLLLDNGADINRFGNLGNTPLMIAAWKGYKNLAELLINNGADINKKGRDDNTALDLACEQGNEKIIKLIKDKVKELENKTIVKEASKENLAANKDRRLPTRINRIRQHLNKKEGAKPKTAVERLQAEREQRKNNPEQKREL
ncbi:MAG: Ankyrin repeat-like protein, partial [Rickettsiaceae bacterium]|nr:Ankyrin repeat-like protein [Rickettsiaceae bacterium]